MDFIKHLRNGGKIKTNYGQSITCISIALDETVSHPIIGYIGCSLHSWTKEGQYYAHCDLSDKDLVAIPESFKEKSLKELEKYINIWGENTPFLKGILHAIRTIEALEE